MITVEYLFLTLPHGQKLELVTPESRSLGKLHQVTGWVGAWTENEYDWRDGSGLLKNRLKTDDRRSDVFLSHTAGNKVRDGQINPIHSEATEEQKALEVCQSFFIFPGKGSSFRGVQVVPLLKHKRTYIVIFTHDHTRL